MYPIDSHSCIYLVEEEMYHGIYRNLVPYILGLSEVNRGKLHSICLLFPFSLLFPNDFCHFQLRKKVGIEMYLGWSKTVLDDVCYKIWYIWVAMSFLPLEKVQSCSLNVVFKYWFTKPRSFALLTLRQTGEESGKVAAWYLFTSWNLWLTHWVMQKQNKLNS